MPKQYTLISSDEHEKIEVCVLETHNKEVEVTISTYDLDEELVEEITLSPQQAEVVRRHLSSTHVQNILFKGDMNDNG